MKPNPNDRRSLRDGLYLVVISREEVEGNDTKPAKSALQAFLDDPAAIDGLRGKVDIALDGYNNDKRELYQIPEVRKYVKALDAAFPYWFYFLSTKGHFLRVVAGCVCKVIEARHGMVRLDPQEMQQFMMGHFPASNEIFERFGLNEKENEKLTTRIMDYFSNGPS